MKKGDFYLYFPNSIFSDNTVKIKSVSGHTLNWKSYCAINATLYPCIFRIK